MHGSGPRHTDPRRNHALLSFTTHRGSIGSKARLAASSGDRADARGSSPLSLGSVGMLNQCVEGPVEEALNRTLGPRPDSADKSRERDDLDSPIRADSRVRDFFARATVWEAQLSAQETVTMRFIQAFG